MKFLRLMLVFLFMSHGAYADEPTRSVSETNTQVVQYIEQLNNMLRGFGHIYHIDHGYTVEKLPSKPFTDLDIPVGFSPEATEILVLSHNIVILMESHVYLYKLQFLISPESYQRVLSNTKPLDLDMMHSDYNSLILEVYAHMDAYTLKYRK